MLVIADAKRGDIGNTSAKYSETFFKKFKCDALTVSPYMGRDSVEPFLEDEEKGVFILALTSNKGSQDFQMQKLANGDYLYQNVIKTIVFPFRLFFLNKKLYKKGNSSISLSPLFLCSKIAR